MNSRPGRLLQGWFVLSNFIRYITAFKYKGAVCLYFWKKRF